MSEQRKGSPEILLANAVWSVEYKARDVARVADAATARKAIRALRKAVDVLEQRAIAARPTPTAGAGGEERG